MNQRATMFVVAALTIVAGCNQAVSDEDQESTKPYFGQTLPGLTPQLFAPGLISTDGLEIGGQYSSNMKEFYFTRQSASGPPKTMLARFVDGVWQEPVPVEGDLGFITPDGSKMLIGSRVKERNKDSWSESYSLGPMFDEFPIMRMTSSNAETYVFDVREEVGVLRYSRLVDGVREKPKAFNEEINSGRWTAHPFIAPDESYLIWDSEREEGFGATDLYISFRQEDGSWGPAKNMGPEINTEFEDGGGLVTPDGKYFFFNTVNLADEFENSEANIFWVDAQIIEDLRKQQ